MDLVDFTIALTQATRMGTEDLVLPDGRRAPGRIARARNLPANIASIFCSILRILERLARDTVPGIARRLDILFNIIGCRANTQACHIGLILSACTTRQYQVSSIDHSIN